MKKREILSFLTGLFLGKKTKVNLLVGGLNFKPRIEHFCVYLGGRKVY